MSDGMPFTFPSTRKSLGAWLVGGAVFIVSLHVAASTPSNLMQVWVEDERGDLFCSARYRRSSDIRDVLVGRRVWNMEQVEFKCHYIQGSRARYPEAPRGLEHEGNLGFTEVVLRATKPPGCAELQLRGESLHACAEPP